MVKMTASKPPPERETPEPVRPWAVLDVFLASFATSAIKEKWYPAGASLFIRAEKWMLVFGVSPKTG